jgi:glycosyltransferase involved in cell wall biosynthesis
MLAGLAAVGVSVDGAVTARGADGEVAGNPPVRRFARQWGPGKPSWPLARWVARHVDRYDVVHVHALFSFASEVAALIARRRGVPYVIRPLGVLNRYGMRLRRPRLKRLWIWLVAGPLLRDAAAVHFTSQAEADEASELGIPMRGVVIPLGVELPEPGDPESMRARFPALRGARVLLFLSRLDPKKNLEGLIDAFSEVAPEVPDLRLLVCGSGASGYVDSLKARATANGVGERVVWAGEVRGAEKASAFALADLFVLPSLSENFGIAVVEALAARVPVVVSDGIPLASRIVEVGAGWRCGTDGPSVAAALRAALDPAIDRRAVGERGRALVAAEYSVDVMGQRLKALYEQILRERAA